MAKNSTSFLPGAAHRGGRPKGALNKATRDIKEWAEKFLTSPEYVKAAMVRVMRGKAPHLEVLWHHYAFGKPKETVKYEGKLPPFQVVFKDDVSDD